MNKIMRNNVGSSLVEVLIAIAILGVFIIPISGMFISSLRTSENSNASIESYSIANRIVEGIGTDEIYIPCNNLSISDEEYTRYNVNKNEFQVKKTIANSDNPSMNSFQLDNVETLTIDASKDGQISFLNVSAPITYTPSGQVTITIRFDDTSVTNGNNIISNRKYDYVKVICGNSNLNLILENKSVTDKTTYIYDMPANGNFSLQMVAATKAQWLSYDNLLTTVKNEAGSVSVADLTVTVRHIPSNKEYSVETKKVFYKYNDATNY